MDNIISRYILAFDEINALVSTSYTLSTGDLEQIINDISSILINAYKLGNQNVSEMLEREIEIELEEMKAAIYKKIDGKTFEDRIASHVNENDLPGLENLVASEFHRVYNNATQDGANHVKDSGNEIVKTWCTKLDDRVRDTHKDLEGVTIPLEESFHTFDGDSALYPGGFKNADNNVNCRCIVLYKINAIQE